MTTETDVAKLCKVVEGVLIAKTAPISRQKLYTGLGNLIDDAKKSRQPTAQTEEQKKFWELHILQDIAKLVEAEDETILESIREIEKHAVELAQRMQHPWPEAFPKAVEVGFYFLQLHAPKMTVLRTLDSLLDKNEADSVTKSMHNAIAKVINAPHSVKWSNDFTVIVSTACKILTYKLHVDMQGVCTAVANDILAFQKHTVRLWEIRHDINKLCLEAEKHVVDLNTLYDHNSTLPVGSHVWILRRGNHVTLLIAPADFIPKPLMVAPPTSRLFSSAYPPEDLTAWNRRSTTGLPINAEIETFFIGKTIKPLVSRHTHKYVVSPYRLELHNDEDYSPFEPTKADKADRLFFTQTHQIPVFASVAYYNALNRTTAEFDWNCVSDTFFLAKLFSERGLIALDALRFAIAVKDVQQCNFRAAKQGLPYIWQWLRNNGIPEMTAEGLANDSLWITKRGKELTKLAERYGEWTRTVQAADVHKF